MRPGRRLALIERKDRQAVVHAWGDGGSDAKTADDEADGPA